MALVVGNDHANYINPFTESVSVGSKDFECRRVSSLCRWHLTTGKRHARLSTGRDLDFLGRFGASANSIFWLGERNMA